MKGISYLWGKADGVRRKYTRLAALSLTRAKASCLHAIIPATKEYDLVIFDDLVPTSLSGFRDYEFAGFLNDIDNAALFSILGNNINPKRSFEYFHIKTIGQYRKNRIAFERAFGVPQRKLKPFRPWTKVNAKLAYVVFLTNADYLIEYFEERKIPFIVELFPGGGFSEQDSGPTFERLKRVLSSPMLYKAFIPEGIVYKFVLAHNLVVPEKIAYFYGCIVSGDFMNVSDKLLPYPIKKQTIDICFAAAKYMPKGLDKGYDIFVDMAHLLLAQGRQFHFHIVGGFDENDIPINSEFRENFHFYGFLKNKAFTDFYADKDIYVSACRPYVLAAGASDGFPTSTSCEAGLHGMCLLLSDPLGLNDIHGNVIFQNGRDAVLLENDPHKFAEIIINLAANPQRIYEIGRNGKAVMQHIYNPFRQFGFRYKMFNEFYREEVAVHDRLNDVNHIH